MWLSVLIVIVFGIGVIIAIFAGGPIGFVLAGIAVLGFIAKFTGALGAQSPTAAEHAERGERLEQGEPTGPAHEGQKHMTPEQI
jgi:hypothetical protein